MKKLIRTTTVGLSLDVLLKGQLHFLNSHFDVVAISGQGNHLTTVATREKVKTTSVHFERKISPFKDLISLFKLYKVLKKEKPFIIHSITPKAGLLSMIAGYFARVPIRMHTFTGLIFPSKSGLIQRILIATDKILCYFATHVYPEGNGVKNDLKRFGITTKPLKVIANGNINGVDCNYFSTDHFSENDNLKLKNELHINQNDFVFIFVGRLVEDKGINELVAAFTRFTKENENSKLLLIGSFEKHLDPLKKTTIKQIKTNKNIISVGYQNDIRPYFAISDCLVFPSYREGFPNVVLQAGAMNLPSIVTDINGSNEIISQNENGLLIAVKNKNAIFEAMQILFFDNALVTKMKKSARENIVSKFEQQFVWLALLNEYELVINALS